MRMKFNKSGQLLLVSAASLLVAGLVTACSNEHTMDFVYVTSAKAAGTNNYGEVDVFEVNSASGHMRQIPTSPFLSGGRNPVAEVVSTDYKYLYVANQDDNDIVEFIIGHDGKLYPQNTKNTPGIYPLAVAASSSYLYVVDKYQPLATCSDAAPCTGAIAAFPIQSDGSLGTAVTNTNISMHYWPFTLSSNPTHVIVPTAVNVTASGAYVYVTAYDSTSPSNGGYVFGFTVNSDGTLTAMNSGVPFAVGTHPSAITSDANSAYVYVTDYTESVVRSYKINSGILTAVSGSPFAAGNEPSALAIDSSSKYLYVTNAQDASVTAYTVNSGTLTRLGTSYTTGLQPVAIGINPSTSHYVYTINFLGNNLSGFQMSSTDGTLINIQGSPYTTNAQPTAIALIPHGSTKK
jgi:6-phosphogluconolactonase (cycloisomerase 2 family)